MEHFTRLATRTLKGMRYEPPSASDTRFHLSVLAGLPVLIGSGGIFISLPANASLVMVWGVLAAFIGITLALVGAVYYIPSRAIRITLILTGWGMLLSYIGWHFLELMRF